MAGDRVTRLRGSALSVISVLALSVLLNGCAVWQPTVSALPGATPSAPAIERAHAVLSAWADAVAAAGDRTAVAPVGELTGQIGEWEQAVADNNKQALMAGSVASDKDLSGHAPGDGHVTWQDGSTTNVPLLSAQEAIVAIESTTAAPCSDCSTLLLTAARLTSGPIETTRGPATAPIWEFTVQGTAVKVTRVAIANAVVSSIAEGDVQLGLAIDSASGSVSGTELTVAFTGAPRSGDEACGEDYTAEAVESDLAVVVIVTRHPYTGLVSGGCTAVGARRTATATLAKPLGARTVLDLQQGSPVPVVLSP